MTIPLCAAASPRSASTTSTSNAEAPNSKEPTSPSRSGFAGSSNPPTPGCRTTDNCAAAPTAEAPTATPLYASPPPCSSSANYSPTETAGAPNERLSAQPLSRKFLASMEGRAIARPNEDDMDERLLVLSLQWRAEQLPGQTRKVHVFVPPHPLSFNGGPSNCPAKRLSVVSCSAATSPLQWRAEQLPGQTTSCPSPSPASKRASMEGRAIARPNRVCRSSGPVVVTWLQWRAEQLPGQTCLRCSAAHGSASFNGGPSNCPAKPLRAAAQAT